MEKPDSTSGSGASTVYNTVFIDTSLDTHLAMVVSDSDTVSDLKKKIMHEHLLCFPDIGDIKINSVKVKRKGCRYHLSDSMFVKSAFVGVTKSWFLSADASVVEEHRENHNSCKPDAGNILACFDITTNNSPADVVDLLPGVLPKRLCNINYASLPQDGDIRLAKQSSASQQSGFSNSTKENSEDLHMEVEHTADSYSKVLFPATDKECRPEAQLKDARDDKMCDNLPASVAVTASEEKHETRKRKRDAIRDHDVKENGALVVDSRIDALDSGRSLSSDQNKRLDTRKRMANEGIKVPGELSECEANKTKDVSLSEQEHMSAENYLQSGPASKIKRKAEKKDGNENFLVENGVKEGTGPGTTTSKSSLGQKLENTSAMLDHLNTESLMKGNASSEKKKRKRQKSNPSQAGSEISSAKDVHVETSLAKETIDRKDLGSEAHPKSVLGKISVAGATSEPCLIPSTEMQKDSRMNGLPHSGGHNDMADTNDDNMESRNNETEQNAVSVTKKRDQNASPSDGQEALVSQEEINLQNDKGVSGHENQNVSLEDTIVEPKKSSKKIKQSKKTKDPVGVGRDDMADTNDDNMESHNKEPAQNVVSVTTKRDSIDQDASPSDGQEVLVSQEEIDLQNVSGHENQNVSLEDKIVEPKMSSKKKKKSKKTKDAVGVGHDDMADTNDDVMESHNEEPAQNVVSGTKKRDSVDQNASPSDGQEALVSQEEINLQNDGGVSGHENKNGSLEDKITEPKKSSKKKRKSKKTMDPVGGTEAVDDVHSRGPASDLSPEQPTSVNDNHLSDNAEQHGTADGKEESKIEESNCLPSVIDVRADDVIRNVLDSLQQFNNGPANLENMDKKSRNKTKKKSYSLVDPSKLLGKDDINPQDPTVSADNVSEVSASSKSTRKTVKVNSRSAAQLNGSDLGSQNNTGAGISDHMQQLDSSQNALKPNHDGRPIQDVVNVYHPKSTHVDDVNNSIEVPSQSEMVRSQQQQEIVDSGRILIDKATDEYRVETEVKGKKKKKMKPEVESGGVRPDLPSSEMSNGKQRKEAKAQVAKSSSIQSQRSSKVEPCSSNVDHPKSTRVDDATNSIEFPSESERVKSQQQQEIVGSGKILIDKVTDEKGVETGVKGKKKKKKPEVEPGGSRPDLPSSGISNGNQHKEAKAQAAKSSSILSQRSSSKVEPCSSNVQSSKPVLTISENVAKEPMLSNKADKINIIPKDALRPFDLNSSRAHTDLDKNARAVSSSSVEISKNSINRNTGVNKHRSHLEIAKATGSNNGKVVNSSANKRSLLAGVGTIFKHNDEESSDDEDGVENVAKEPMLSNKADKINTIPKDALRPIDHNSSRAHTDLDKNARAVSSSSVEISKNSINRNTGVNKHRSHLEIAKATGSNNGKVVNSLANKRSLLAGVGTIFKHNDEESSDDEDGVDNSDASTRTPSDSSSSSDFSDNSDVDASSSRNGSDKLQGEEAGGRNRQKPGPKSMSLHAILLSSSRYKKAKLTASQGLDSQPDEFVPNSQAT